jgi:SAM-dependent methyltransferase
MSDRWYETFFRGIAVDVWSNAIPAAATSAEADFLEKILAPRPNCRLLDVPCGHGRHAIELARRGHRLSGVDLSEEFLARARSSAGTLPVEFLHRDMRDLPWSAEFDGAFCFGNSFGYLDAAEAEIFLRAVAKALKPGGRFAIETGMAAESILASLPARRWHRIGQTFMLSEALYHPLEGRLDIQYTFLNGSEVDSRPSSSYVLTLSQIRRMMEHAGFVEIQAYNGIDGQPYGFGSPRLIIAAARKE